MEHITQGNTDLALTEFATLIHHNPDYVPAYQMSAQTLAKLGRTEEAITRLKEGLAAAQRTNNAHAASEMQALSTTSLDSLNNLLSADNRHFDRSAARWRDPVLHPNLSGKTTPLLPCRTLRTRQTSILRHGDPSPGDPRRPPRQRIHPLPPCPQRQRRAPRKPHRQTPRLREDRPAARKIQPLFPGIVGYEDTVIPQLVNAVLSRHNFILLGLRGQAKSRILRALTTLLDPALPYVAGSEVRDNPYAPISKFSRDLIAKLGDETPIAWLTPDDRFVEKLATPDVTVADLVGDIDPIKAARSNQDLGSELTMHYGLLPRANRGIFAINEIPDLAGKIQVALFNIMQEGDVQIKGYPVRLPLDVAIVFSANPEDYTARGKIVTPLKDRIGSEIRTHYPENIEEGIAITAQEAWTNRAKQRRAPGSTTSKSPTTSARSSSRSPSPPAKTKKSTSAAASPSASPSAPWSSSSPTPNAAPYSTAKPSSSPASATSTPHSPASAARSSSSTKARCAAPTPSSARSSAPA